MLGARFVDEDEFQHVFCAALDHAPTADYVTGPGRSGAVAAVYASHYLGIPFVPFKRMRGSNVLVVDTAILTGSTLRKASRYYFDAPTVHGFTQPPRVKFWYERLSHIRGKYFEYRRAA